MLTETQRELRSGNFTASEIWKLMKPKGFGETGQTYIKQKVAEHFGVFAEEARSRATDHGNELEPEAARFYELASGVKLESLGFILAPWNDHAGASPDRKIVGQNKGVELKCPYNPKNHIEHLTIKSATDLKKVNEEYYWQVQMEIAVTLWDSIDFVSFDPRFPASLRMCAIEIKPEASDIALIKSRIEEAVTEMQKIIKLIKL